MKTIMQSMNHLMFEYICTVYKMGRFDELKRMGVSLETAQMIARLSMSDIIALSRFRAPLFQLTPNLNNLPHLLSHLEREAEQEDKIRDLIQRGATYSVINALTGATRSEFNQMCLALGTDPKRNAGKPRNLTDDEIVQHAAVWASLDSSLDPLSKFCQLVTETNIPPGPAWRWMQVGGE